MRTVRSTADLHRLALAAGAEVMIDGRPWNSSRAQVAVGPKPPAEPAPEPEPTPAPVLPEPLQLTPPGELLTREEVDRMISAHNDRVTLQLAHILREIRAAPASVARPEPREWQFSIEYGPDHEITHVNAKATP